MGDRSAERTFAPGAIGMDMNPLPIAGACAKPIDAVLIDATQSDTPRSRPTKAGAIAKLYCGVIALPVVVMVVTYGRARMFCAGFCRHWISAKH